MAAATSTASLQSLTSPSSSASDLSEEKESPQRRFSSASESESSKLRHVVDIALLQVDHKTGKEILNPEKKWTIHNTKDKNVSVIYRKLDNDGMITMRSTMDIECSMDDVFEFFDCESNDDLKMAIKNDKMMTSYQVHKVYDENKCLVHTTFSTGAPKHVIKPRDFLYIKTRFKFENYDASKMAVNGLLGYSVGDDHPNYVNRAHKHVRGWIHYTGVIAIAKTPTVSTLCYVACADLCGKIPKKIVNFITPAQGMNIKKFAASIDEARELIARRNKTKLQNSK